MLEWQSKAAAATDELKSFLLLAKTAKGAACVALVKQVLDSPSIFVFGELLDMPNVQEVRAPRAHLRAPSWTGTASQAAR